MTQAPLPTWAALGRALRGPGISLPALTNPWRRAGDVAGLLSRSSWSLALVAEWRRRAAPDRPVTFWVPAFFCESALLVLRRAGTKFVFYPVNNAFEPDVAAFGPLAADAPPDIVMAVHYFGRPSPLAPLHDFCTRHNAWLIEDAAHVLKPISGVGSQGDFVIYSPHKLLAIPDGAVLVARENGASRLGPAAIAAFGEPARWPQQLDPIKRALGGAVRSVDARAVVWVAKRLLQKLGMRGSAPRPPFIESFTTTAVPDLPQPAASTVAKRLLSAQAATLGERHRERNQLLWDAALMKERDVEICARPADRAWTPYLAAYSPADAEERYREWGSRGLLVTTWPDLPPEVRADQTKYAHAWRLRHSRVYLPVHQSISPRAIARQQLRSRGEDATPAEIRWDSASADQWSNWQRDRGRSSLLQDWAYGDAKAEAAGWQVRRAVFIRSGADAQPVAIAQMHERRLGGLVTLRRMNRAPDFLSSATSDDARAVWQAIARLGRAATGQLLFATPDERLSGQAVLSLVKLGFRPARSAGGWQSIWIDLRLPADELRRRLQKEWRNALGAAERAGLTADVSDADDAFQWMLSKYAELMGEKHFAGPSMSLLTSLRSHARNDQVRVVRAWRGGAPIAGVLVVRHGDAATYVIGWNGPEGRTHKANHFLLWTAASHLAAAGVRWFDLGGLDEERTPGIAAFKLGMGGERYELAGDFLKW